MSGLLSTHDGGASWHTQNFGSVPSVVVSGRYVLAAAVWCPASDPCPGGRLWRSPVTSDNWTPAGVPGPINNPRVYAQGSTVWLVNIATAGVLSGPNAIFASTDAGASFQRVTDPCPNGIAQLAPVAVSYLFLDCGVITNENTGVWRHNLFRSADGGHSWVSLGSDPVITALASMSAPNPQTVYLAEDPGDFVVSRDSGHTWATALHGSRVDAATGAQTGRTVSFVGFQDQTHGLALAGPTTWVTTDNGQHWSKGAF